MTPPREFAEIFYGQNHREVIVTRGINLVATAALILLAVGCSDKSGSNSPVFGTGRQLKPEHFPNIRNSIYGSWSGDQAEFGNEMVFLTTYYFNQKNEIGVKRTCVGNGEELSVATVVDGEIMQDSVSIKASVQVSRKGERISNCTLTIHEGSFIYNLSGDRLEVVNKGADARSYTRVQ